MSFPQTISTSIYPLQGFASPWQAPNGAYYALGSAGATLSVLKSVDSGVTWTVQDSAHEPPCGGSLPYSGVLAGTKIWAVSATGSGAGDHFQVSSYSTLTDTWQSTHVSGILITSSPGAGIVYRNSDANLIITWNQFNAISNNKPFYFTFDTGSNTFSGTTAIGTAAIGSNCFCVGILLGSGEFDFLLFNHDTLTGGTRTVSRQPLTDGGVLGGITVIATITDAGTSRAAPYGYSDGTNAIVAWLPTDLNPLQVDVLRAPVSTWAFTTVTISVPGSEDETNQLVPLIDGSTSLVVVASQNFTASPYGSFWLYTDTGSGFGGAAVLGTIPYALNDSQNQQQVWGNILTPGTQAITFVDTELAPPEYNFAVLAGVIPPVNPCPCYLHCPGGDALSIYCTPCSPPLTCCTCKV